MSSNAPGSSRTQRRNRNRRLNRAKKAAGNADSASRSGNGADSVSAANADAKLNEIMNLLTGPGSVLSFGPNKSDTKKKGKSNDGLKTPPKFTSMEEYYEWVNGPPSSDEDDGLKTPPKFSTMEEYYEWVNGPPSDDDEPHQAPSAPSGPPGGINIKDQINAYLDWASGPNGTGFVRAPKTVEGYNTPLPPRNEPIPRMNSLEEYLDWTSQTPEEREEANDSDNEYCLNPDEREVKYAKKSTQRLIDAYDPAKGANNLCFNSRGATVYVKSDVAFKLSSKYKNHTQPVYLGPLYIDARRENAFVVSAPAHKKGHQWEVPFEAIQPCFKSIIPGYPVEPPWDTSEQIRRMRMGEVASCVATCTDRGVKHYYVNWKGCNPHWVSWITEREFNQYDLKEILARSVSPGASIPVIPKET
ncbi:hypothetical protein CJU90_3200 [Yarrowia sp. C11]|nr:hypothetical protein CKK34_4648 [Yarrowia sp. E02]KAG5369698.1 hypothetical protein CJU90_3200 [Yarrowia sp. C11]